jgi:hypothetical protein
MICFGQQLYQVEFVEAQSVLQDSTAINIDSNINIIDSQELNMKTIDSFSIVKNNTLINKIKINTDSVCAKNLKINPKESETFTIVSGGFGPSTTDILSEEILEKLRRFEGGSELLIPENLYLLLPTDTSLVIENNKNLNINNLPIEPEKKSKEKQILEAVIPKRFSIKKENNSENFES